MGKDISAIAREMRKHARERAVVWHSDPFRVLISTVLSQRTKDANTEKASRQLFAKYSSSPMQIAGAELRRIEKLIKPAGFYRQKARRIREIAREIVNNFDGKVPRSRELLLGLKGVGPKTAACVLVYGFGEDALPVDTHVHRISNRIGLVETKIPEQTEQALMQAIPRKYWRELNHLMVRYGQKVCLPKKPRCQVCGIRTQCDYYLGVVGKK